MKQFAIMDGDMFLQRLEPNERYAKSVRGIQTDLHTYSEYTPIFGHEEKWMDGRTATGYLDGLVEFQKWEGDYYHAYALICREERKEADHEVSWQRGRNMGRRKRRKGFL